MTSDECLFLLQQSGILFVIWGDLYNVESWHCRVFLKRSCKFYFQRPDPGNFERTQLNYTHYEVVLEFYGRSLYEILIFR